MTRKTVLVTGGAGFIGSAVIRMLIAETDCAVVNVDKLTYAADLRTLAEVEGNPRYTFAQVDICDAAAIAALFQRHSPDVVMHLAAESHVDRSINGPAVFIQTNVVGTCVMLEAALTHWRSLDEGRRAAFRFLHVSTDEVFGQLGDEGYFSEETPYKPNSPYSASKAGSDHLARAWFHTFGLPVLTSNCSNNYGPYQFPEKLIPLMITNALDGLSLPVYGKGDNTRDWLFVEDHARALWRTVERGTPGECYLFGGRQERKNLEVVHAICRLLDQRRPRPDGSAYESLISYVVDRPGHDFRYAIDPTKAETQLDFHASLDFETGLARTVDWYLSHEDWWRPLLKRAKDARG